MVMMRPATLALLLILPLAACSKPAERALTPNAASHNERVVVEHQIDYYDDARQTAIGQCANFGKEPRLRQILYKPTGRQLAVFDCLL
jgi:hypothetical protein